MNWLQRWIRQAQKRRPLAERVLRREHTIHFSPWAEPDAPRQRWSLSSLTDEHPSAEAAVAAHVRDTHIPPARSTLSVLEAFVIAQNSFNHDQYDVYVARGNTEWVKPLIGTNSVIVLERLNDEAHARQPLVVGDVVLFNWREQVVMHHVTQLDTIKQQLLTHYQQVVPFRDVHSRLAAVFFTQPPNDLQQVEPSEPHYHNIVVDTWDDRLLRPLVPQDKPSPHSAITLRDDDPRLDWRLLRRAMREHNGDVWRRIANTNSMEPFIDAGTALPFERLTTEAEAIQPLRAGDIVNWGTPEFGRLHRIIGRAPNQQYYIKGDNNAVVDHLHGRQLISRAQIKHRVVGVIYTQQQRLGD